MPKFPPYTVFGIVFFLFLSLPLLSQATEKTDSGTVPNYSAATAYYWLEFSGGLGTTTSSSISLNGEVGPLRLGLELRQSSMGELDIFGEPDPVLRALNLKVGKLFKGESLLLDLHAGIGFGNYGIPVNVESQFLGYDYDLNESPSFSWMVAAQGSLNFKVFLLGLNLGATGARGDAGVYAGLTLGFGKFF